MAVWRADQGFDSFTVPHTAQALRRLHATGLDRVVQLVVDLFRCSLESSEIFVILPDRDRDGSQDAASLGVV